MAESCWLEAERLMWVWLYFVITLLYFWLDFVITLLYLSALFKIVYQHLLEKENDNYVHHKAN